MNDTCFNDVLALMEKMTPEQLAKVTAYSRHLSDEFLKSAKKEHWKNISNILADYKRLGPITVSGKFFDNDSGYYRDFVGELGWSENNPGEFLVTDCQEI